MPQPSLSRRSVLSALAASPVAADMMANTARAASDLAASGLVGKLEGPTMITDPAK